MPLSSRRKGAAVSHPRTGTAALHVAAFLALGAALPGAAPSHASEIGDLFNKVKSSVVVIRTVSKASVPPPGAERLAEAGVGSGVLIDPAGLVITAAHVVQAADSVAVEFLDGESIPARVVASEPVNDVALLQLQNPPRNPTPATWGDSDKVEVGDTVVIVGAPLGISHTLTVGHISGRRASNKLFGGTSSTELFQTDAVVNKGNSGGPMFNVKGEVIGIVSSMITTTGGYEGLGFVVTSKVARLAVLERQPWSGLDGYMLTGKMAQLLNLPQPMGILVQRVAARSPAERMGLLQGDTPAKLGDEEVLLGGDVILEVMGVTLDSPAAVEKIRALIRDLAPGQRLELTVLRGGRLVELSGVMVQK